jgi:hypothetical protein
MPKDENPTGSSPVENKVPAGADSFYPTPETPTSGALPGEGKPTSETPTKEGVESAPVSETGEKKTPETKPPERTDATGRIKGLVKENKQLKGELETLRKQNPKPPEKRQPKPEPKVEDFPSYEEHAKAHRKWEVDEAVETRLDEERTRQRDADQKAATDKAQKDAADKRLQEFQSRVEVARQAHDDFAQVVDDNEDIELDDHTVALINDSDIPGELLYHFGSNPDDAKRFAAMSQWRREHMFLELETRLRPKKAEETPVPPITRAPKPPSNVGGGSAPPKQKTAEEVLYG